ncbi:MAG TPA: hypothetical protein VHZ74_05180 [Bryobacteraceae bacterium]|jgi:plastocyanin|nr:hypothetical protein [Bryobacteraceae bacterium]
MTPASQTEKALHSVGIHIKGSGFAYLTPDNRNAATIHVRHGDRIKWNCDHGNYTVLFKGESPFGQAAVHGFKKMETTTSVITAKPGRYTYAVTVALEDGGLIVDDPEIIVDGN